MPMKVFAVIAAAGSSERFGGAVPKQFREVCGRPLLSWTISRFEAARSIDGIVVVASEDSLLHVSQHMLDPFDFSKVTKVVAGGETRRESVWNGLQALPVSTDFVAIHDGARPLIKPADIDRAVEVARQERAAIVAVKATDTVKHVKERFVLSTLDRDELYLAQTPQVFQYDLIMAAHKEAAAGDHPEHYTDDASIIEARGFKVKAVEPTGPNPKVTTRDDLALVEALLLRESHEESPGRPRL
ncbi:MAG: 2-C-methyl-D-erythritol 4-phosphate cytidylyltransferase [Candidatus Zixiibacteriota bacterium]